MDSHVLERILDISRSMAETRQLEPLLAYAMAHAMELVGAERGYLVLLRSDGSLDFRVQQDSGGSLLEHPEDQISHSILNQVLETGQPVNVNDAQTDPSFSTARSVMTLQLRSVMCVPLISRGQVIGAMYVENRHAAGIFQNEDIVPLTLFANQAAVSIENAALNEDLERRVEERTAELQTVLKHLEQSWTDAVEADRMRISVLSHVAHDVRAPLHIAITALSMFCDGTFGELAEEQLHWLHKSLDAVQHASSLMNDVFDMAKIEAGKLELNREIYHLPLLLKQIYEIELGMPRSTGVALKLELTPDLPTDVSLDSTRIRQILLNLLSNALKYTEQGSITLYACPKPDERAVLIGVRDTGEGIPADKLDQIFERFQQADRNPVRRQMGMGLGLAICRELVELHGGRIWVESAAGQGADFKFTLPV